MIIDIKIVSYYIHGPEIYLLQLKSSDLIFYYPFPGISKREVRCM
jgi:hypothetical protein